MSVAGFIRRCLDLGMPFDLALSAAEAMEAEMPPAILARTKGAERTARWRERHKASQVTESDVVTLGDASPSKEVSPAPLQETQPHTPPSPPKGAHGSAIKRFDDFWRAYPRKVGKGAARKAFDRALGKIAATDPHAVLMAALAKIRPAWTDPQFIPHPATWLNEERWEDGEAVPVVEVEVLTPDQQAERQAAWARIAEEQMKKGAFVNA